MKIYKVLVDEVPRTCSDCFYFGNLIFGIDNFCELSRQVIKVDDCDKKPDWCPLKEYVDNTCHCKRCDPNSYENYYDDEDDDEKS